MLTFSNNPEVAGGNVYLLGVTPGNSAERAGRLRDRARPGSTFRRALRPGRDRGGEPRRGRAATGRTAPALAASQAYPLSQQGVIDTVAEHLGRGLQNAGANAVILTDGPRARRLPRRRPARERADPDRACCHGHAALGQPGRRHAAGACRARVYAAPDPALAAAFEGRYQRLRRSARTSSPCSPTTASPRSAR